MENLADKIDEFALAVLAGVRLFNFGQDLSWFESEARINLGLELRPGPKYRAIALLGKAPRSSVGGMQAVPSPSHRALPKGHRGYQQNQRQPG
ncbi:MAG: hypothetical protein WBN82_12385 [Porticoccaceae bacterium]